MEKIKNRARNKKHGLLNQLLYIQTLPKHKKKLLHLIKNDQT